MNPETCEYINSKVTDSVINSFFKGPLTYEALQTLISAALIEGEKIKIQLGSQNDILNILPTINQEIDLANKIFRGEISCKHLIKLTNSSKYLYSLWEELSATHIEYKFLTGSLVENSQAYSEEDEPGVIATNVTEFEFAFYSIEPITLYLDPLWILRIISYVDYDMAMTYIRMIEVNGVDKNRTDNKFMLDLDYYNLFKNRLNVESNSYLQKIISFEYHNIIKLTSNNPLNNDIKSFYEQIDIESKFNRIISIDELKTFEQTNKLGEDDWALFFTGVGGSEYHMLFYDSSIFTIDMINVPSNKTVIDHSNDIHQSYATIINGPFYAGVNANKLQHFHIGYRKFRNTYDGIPKLIDKSTVFRYNYDNLNSFTSKLYCDSDKNTHIDTDRLTDTELTSILSGADCVNYIYKSSLGENSPCKPSSSTHPEFLENAIGKLWYRSPIAGIVLKRYEDGGIPIIGLVESSATVSPKKYIFILIRSDDRGDNPNIWQEFYQILDNIKAQIAVFTDGSDSVFLHHKLSFVEVGFDKEKKNEQMPCLIGIIEKNKIIN